MIKWYAFVEIIVIIWSIETIKCIKKKEKTNRFGKIIVIYRDERIEEIRRDEGRDWSRLRLLHRTIHFESTCNLDPRRTYSNCRLCQSCKTGHADPWNMISCWPAWLCCIRWYLNRSPGIIYGTKILKELKIYCEKATSKKVFLKSYL